MMKGAIGVESEVGNGSTFWFTACFDIAEGAALQTAPATTSQHIDRSMRGTNVLVAEDNEANRLVASIMLGKLECNAHIVVNGQEAVEALAERDFDVIFMDCHMPVLDGFEATRMIRRTEAGRKRRVIIAMTANALQGEKERCIESGMDDFLSKPVMLDELAAKLRAWVKKENMPSEENPEPEIEEPEPEQHLDRSRLKYLQDLSSRQDSTLFEKLIRSFLDDAPARILTMKNALASNDARTLFTAAHSLKGISGNIGAMCLMAISQSLQEAGGEGNLIGVDPRLREAEAELEIVRKILESEFSHQESQA
jgi:CheY-like chemotaxis protein/HPt (histidine-containing phosphotransfer) domain-containing protein